MVAVIFLLDNGIWAILILLSTLCFIKNMISHVAKYF